MCMQDHFLRYGRVSPPPSEKSPYMAIFTLCGHFHLTWAILWNMGILTSCGHIQWAYSAHMDILNLYGHFHLMCTQDQFLRYGGVSPPPSEKSPLMGHFHLAWTFSPCVGIFTLCKHSHIMWAFSPHIHSHLIWTFSPYVHTCSPPRLDCESVLIPVWKSQITSNLSLSLDKY